MNLEEYHKMHALERDYWWFQGRRQVILRTLAKLVKPHLPRNPRLLDIGCGTGMLLDDLKEVGSAVGLDYSMLALEYCRKRNLPNLGRADACNLPVQDDSVDVITALDVIEHIGDDAGMLAEMQRVLKPGGVAIMSVPAHPKLWSGHDVALHHFRRYTKDSFRHLVTSHGLQPRKFTYSMATAYVPAVIFRNVKRLLKGDTSAEARTDEFQLPALVNASLRASVGLEARLLQHMNLPIGLSLLCVAEKPNTAERR